jgi:hypothetical protein
MKCVLGFIFLFLRLENKLMGDLLKILKKAPYWSPTDVVFTKIEGLSNLNFIRTMDFLKTFEEWESVESGRAIEYTYRSNGRLVTTTVPADKQPDHCLRDEVAHVDIAVTSIEGVSKFVVAHETEEPYDGEVPIFVQTIERCAIHEETRFVYKDFTYLFDEQRAGVTLQSAECSPPVYRIEIVHHNPAERARTPSILAKSFIMKGKSMFPGAVTTL